MPQVSVGVLLNPIAGFGGKLAMHGTDKLPAERFGEAVAAGRAEKRLLRALDVFRSRTIDAELLVAPGLLGQTQLEAAGIPHRVLHVPTAKTAEQTTREHTQIAAKGFSDVGVDCLLFAGGDGTATDIARSVGTLLPVVGVPAGVKMHSEIFARSPERAGRLLAEFVRTGGLTELVEVLDVGPDDRTGVVAQLLAPRVNESLQGAKTSPPPRDSEVVRRAIARELMAHASPDTTWIVGPGRTTGTLAEALGFAATLRGFDVRYPSGDVECDVDEARLFAIVSEATHPRLILGVVGGQGFLLGRGNLEISRRVFDCIGIDRVDIIAAEEKIAGIFPPVLLIDVDNEGDVSNDLRTGHPLEGYRRVHTGVQKSMVMKVVDASA